MSYRILIRQDAVTESWTLATDLPTFSDNDKHEFVYLMEMGEYLDKNVVDDAAHAVRAVAVNLLRKFDDHQTSVVIEGCSCAGEHE